VTFHTWTQGSQNNKIPMKIGCFSQCERLTLWSSRYLISYKICGLFVAFTVAGLDIVLITLSYIQIFITVFRLPQKEARLKAFNTCVAHICVFLQFYSLGFFSFFAHRFGSLIPPYIHILFSSTYLLVPPFLNPLVYGAKTKQIRVHMIKIFCSKNLL